LTITLNGDPFTLAAPMTVTALLGQLGIDPRSVAVERNFLVVKRDLYPATLVEDGDQVEIVNFVGGG
jgi:thiazole synthase